MSSKQGLIYRVNLVRPMVRDPMTHVVNEIDCGLKHIRLLAKEGKKATVYKDVFLKKFWT